MKVVTFPKNILLIILLVLVSSTLFYDILKYSSALTFSNWELIHESFSILIIIIYFFYVKNKPFLSENDISKNLKQFVKLLAIIYLWVFIFKFALSPSFTASEFPKEPETFSSLIYSNIIAIGAIVFLIPMIIILKNLIFYKHKKRTHFYITLTLFVSLLAIIITSYYKQPLQFDFSVNYIIGIVTLVTAILFFIVSTRNSWITYLSRKEKYTYFLTSLILVLVLLPLYNFAFEDSVGSHSLSLAAFTNLCSWFLLIYTSFACVTFLFHLPTAKVFDRKLKEVNSLHQLSRVISAEFDSDKLIKNITKMTTEVIESNHSWIELYDENNDKLYLAAASNIAFDELKSIKNHALEEISFSVIDTKRPVTVNDIAKNKNYSSLKKWKRDINSLAAAPMLSRNDQILGIIFATKIQEYGFDPDDTNMLEAYANQAAIAIENARLISNSLKQERMERELQIARDVQLRLLPQQLPDSGKMKIDTLTLTAYEVGGDYYDFYKCSDNCFGLIIGDVSGKGTSAAFYMAETKGIIQSLSRNYSSPKEILIQTNNILFDSLDKTSFITLLAAVVNYDKGVVEFARAGHCPVLHYNSKEGKVSILQPSGIAIGLNRDEIFINSLKQEKIKIGKDDILAFYTDGLTEAMNKEGDEFGEERFAKIIEDHHDLDVYLLKEKLIDEILAFLQGNNLHDDLTLVLLKN